MANHVYYYVTVNSKAKCLKDISDKLASISSNIDGTTEGDPIEVIKELYDHQGEVENDYNFFIERVGAKWCHIDDVDYHLEEDSGEATLNVSGYSAWSPPRDLFKRIYENIIAEDPDSELIMDHDDEAYNFVGRFQYLNGNEYEYFLDNTDLIHENYLSYPINEETGEPDEEECMEMDWDMLGEAREQWSDWVTNGEVEPNEEEEE